MKKFIGYICLLAMVSSIGIMSFDTLTSLSGWSDIPQTKIPFKYYHEDYYKEKNINMDPQRKEVANESDLVVNIDDFSYTGVIKASAYNPFVPFPRRPPPKKK